MGLKSVAVAVAAIAVIGGVVAAQSSEEAGRYSMSPADGGFVRLDTQTGAMSLCAKKADQWSCEAMADGQQALRAENEKLAAEVKSLKEQIKGMEEVFGLGTDKKPEAGTGTGPSAELKLPSEQDVDHAFDYLERMMKKFRERMKQLEGDNKPSTPL